MFNTLKYVKKLEEVGITRQQAEAHIQIVSEIMENNLATRQDMNDLRQEFKQDMSEMRHEIAELRHELKHEISLLDQKMIQSEQRLTIKLGTIVSIAMGAAVALMKLVG